MGTGRRRLLAGLGAAALGRAGVARAAATLRLRPGGLAVTYAITPAGAQTQVALAGEGGAFSLPGLPDGALVLPIAGRQVLGCTTVLPGGQRLLCILGWDDVALRILAVESRAWAGPGRRGLAMRIAAVPDGARLRLLYDAVHGSQHESWTDILAWRAGALLASEPLRPVLPGTLQARMAAVRARVLALLDATGRSLEAAQLAPTGLLDPLQDG